MCHCQYSHWMSFSDKRQASPQSPSGHVHNVSWTQHLGSRWRGHQELWLCSLSRPLHSRPYEINGNCSQMLQKKSTSTRDLNLASVLNLHVKAPVIGNDECADQRCASTFGWRLGHMMSHRSSFEHDLMDRAPLSVVFKDLICKQRRKLKAKPFSTDVNDNMEEPCSPLSMLSYPSPTSSLFSFSDDNEGAIIFDPEMESFSGAFSSPHRSRHHSPASQISTPISSLYFPLVSDRFNAHPK